MYQAEDTFSDICLSENTGRQDAAEPWQMARNRVIGYLDALGFDPRQALEITRHILDITRDRLQGQSGGTPVAVAMQQLRRQLRQYGRGNRPDDGRLPDGKDCFLKPVPPITPGWMRPQRLQLYPGQKLFKYLAETIDLRRSAPYTLLVIVLMVMYFMT